MQGGLWGGIVSARVIVTGLVIKVLWIEWPEYS